MCPEARSRVINMISQRLGFSFREEDLPPKLRKEIGFVAQRLDMYDQTVFTIKKTKSTASNRIGVIVFLIIVGVIFCFVYLIGIVFFVATFFAYRSYKKIKMKVKDKEAEADSLRLEIDNRVKQLSDSAYGELSLLHEARVRPTVKHLMVDFADIAQAVKGKGIILSTIECPYCKGAVEIPESGEYFKCKYCGKTIYATKIFDKIKGILKE